jgi:hypothetical protein
VLAASRRPDTALGMVLLDSPILSGWKARALQFAKAAGVGERLSPGHVSKRRREHWPSADAAHQHFAAKPLFAGFAPEVLRDYIACGTVPQGGPREGPEGGAGGRRLAFDRGIETAIYNSLPHHFTQMLRRQPVAVPACLHQGFVLGRSPARRTRSDPPPDPRPHLDTARQPPVPVRDAGRDCHRSVALDRDIATAAESA